MKTNSLVWGAFGSIGMAVFALVVSILGDPLPGSVFSAGMGGFFWAWVVSEIRNYLSGRR